MSRVTLLNHLLERSAERVAEKTAVVQRERRISYGDLDRAANRIARALVDDGVRAGDRAVILLPNSIEFVASHFAVLKAGGISVPLDPMIASRNLSYTLRDCTPAALICDAARAPGILDSPAGAGVPDRAYLTSRSGARPPAEPVADRRFASLDAIIDAGDDRRPDVRRVDADLGMILYTSGSTGHPKGVMLSHLNTLSAIGNIIDFVGMAHDDVAMNILALSHSFGLQHLHCFLRLGATFVTERDLRHPDVVLRQLRAEQASFFAGAPVHFHLLLGRYRPLFEQYASGLRYIIIDSAPMPPDAVRKLRATLPNTAVFMYYGLTEASRATFLNYDEGDDKIESVGRATPNVDVRILNEHGRELPPGQVGEIVIRGSIVMQGYWNLPDETAKTLRPEGLRSGDLALMDDDGHLFLKGRLKDIINVGGMKCAPLEVEAVLNEHPAIRECAIVGAPDPTGLLNEAVKAVIVREEGACLTRSEIARHCVQRLEPHKIPRIIEFRDELPKTNAGKIRRELLR